MQITIQVYDKDGIITFDLPEDTTVQQIKCLVAEELKFSEYIKDMTFIFDQRIINDDSITLFQLGYNAESKIILFLPRYIRSKNEGFHKSPIINSPPKPVYNNQQIFQAETANQVNENNMNFNNNSVYGQRQMRYIPLKADSPQNSLFQRLYKDIQSVYRRETPYTNPWKAFLLSNNMPFQDPLVKENFEIASKLNQEQIMFICDSLMEKKLSLAAALDILAHASYDPNLARQMA